MTTPSLHGSLTPLPRDRDIRAATASIATAGAVFLAVIAAALIPGSPIYSVVSAAGVALGAASLIAQLRHRSAPRIYQWLSALGGFVILALGILVAVARIGDSALLSTAGLISTFYLMPVAALACYLGGLGQLPLKWIGPTLLATGGAAATVWLSLGADNTATITLISLAALTAIVGNIFPLARAVRRRPTTGPGWLLLIPATLMTLLMIYMIGLALLPDQIPWPWLSPVLVAWTYMISGVLATVSGLATSSRS
ncbi:hypothetical protein [uncultured Corynebacterium sp.]|uniref:hypothetical protein n=1 Tax=uncultured Corynebacterium sp. TaxID=159447 RepID=UPI0025FB040D|nr:hypothetical protein [uncultured Corynebacterium sp.]